jgi:hypothetical protein
MQLHDADLTVESDRWPVLAGHERVQATFGLEAAQSG